VTYTDHHWINLTDGNWSFMFYANDTAGNWNYTTVNFTVDTAAPTMNVTSPINQSVQNIIDVLINFTAEDQTGVDKMWYWNGTGNTTYTEPHWINLSSTIHRLIFYVNDTLGHLNFSVVNFTVDLIAPQIIVYSPEWFVNYSVPDLLVNFTAIDDSLNLTWYWNGTGNTTTYTPHHWINLTDGNYSFIFYANDSVGHFNYTIVNFTIDAAAPTMEVYSPVNASVQDVSEVLINFTAWDQTGVDTLWYTNETGNMTYTGHHWINVSDGNHLFLFYANDTLGHLNTTRINFTVDTTPPEIYYGNLTEENFEII